MASKWAQKFAKLDGAVTEERDPFKTVISTSSPSLNFIFGKTHGFPLGYTTVLFGPPKGGKSVISHLLTGWLHQNDPTAEVIKFDTEFRSAGQLTPESCAAFGIDRDRMTIIETNSPVGVFDQIEKDIAAQCEVGAPVKMIIVDSVSGIQGRRETNLDSIEKQTIGDHAQTIQIGLKRILPVIRKHNIALLLTTQVRAEMDQTEQMRGNKFRMNASFGLQHVAEYFISVEPNRNKEGRSDIFGHEFVNSQATDLVNKGEQVAMKIRAKMRDSSLGPKGRTGEFTFHFKYGVINTHEEVFKLATNRGIVGRPNNQTYEFGGQTWRSKEGFVTALQQNPELCVKIIDELKRRDLAGDFMELDQPVEIDETA